MDEDQAKHLPCFHWMSMTLHLGFSLSFLLLSVVDKDTLCYWNHVDEKHHHINISRRGPYHHIVTRATWHQQHAQGQTICVCLLVITYKHFNTVTGDYIFSHVGAFSEESMLAFLRNSLNFSPLLCPQEVFGNDDFSKYIKNGGFIGVWCWKCLIRKWFFRISTVCYGFSRPHSCIGEMRPSFKWQSRMFMHLLEKRPRKQST